MTDQIIMKKKYFLGLVLISLFAIDLRSQLCDGGRPFALEVLKSTMPVIPQKKMPAFDIDKMLEEDKEFPTPYRYAKIFNVHYNVKKEGTHKVINNNDTVWYLTIEASGAYSINISFKDFKIPKGAKLFVYNSDKSLYYGAFTHRNNKEYRKFAIADLPGDIITIEYFEPSNAEYRGSLVLGSIGHAYKDIFSCSVDEIETSSPANIDVNCFEGKDWGLEKHSVARMSFSGYLCTGALINNTSNDGTPYFLSAHHCISDENTANTLITYFNYETEGCGGPIVTFKTLSGASLIATDTMADFTLLRLDVTPDTSYKPYYAGWDIEDIAPSKSTGIHHPQGDVKKISHDLDSSSSYDGYVQWNDDQMTIPNTHWMVQFDLGITERGSSGSPLFNQDRRIVGQLHGGTNRDLYGKLYTSWDSGLEPDRKLEPYLDPTSSGVTKIDGYHPDMKPDVDFKSHVLEACLNTPVQLYDLSVFNPTQWNWLIQPSTVTFEEGTDATSQNPVVSFNESGTYTISLTASNANGNSTKVMTDYISAGSTIDVWHIPDQIDQMCGDRLENFKIFSYGADSFHWSIDTATYGHMIEFSNPNEDTVSLQYGSDGQFGGSFSIPVQIQGYHGSCSSTTTITLDVIKQQNDNVSQAIHLNYGLNGPYSNKCATVQFGEPAPPEGDCNTQETWCDEGGLQNSIWFTFDAPSSGIVTIKAPGFDNQLAVYEADTYTDILDNNYDLLAANDDYDSGDYSAVIQRLGNLTPDKTYWLQVDGSAGGAVGTFSIRLTEYIVGIDDIISSKQNIRIFPNPINNILNVEMVIPLEKNITWIKIFNVLGEMEIEDQWMDSNNTDYSIDISKLQSGLYFLKVHNGNKMFNATIIKK